MANQEENVAIMETESTDKYYIEYRGFLSNHLSHGLIALDRLGAPAKRLHEFTKWYQPRLESPDGFTKENQSKLEDVDIEALKGRRQSYYVLLNHYESLLQKKYQSTDEMIRHEFPKVSQGMAGSLLHGLIHLGYAWASGSKKLIREGLAYLHHSYFPLDVSRREVLVEPLGSPGDMDILDVFNLVKQDASLAQTIAERATDPEATKLQYLGIDVGFQRWLGSLLAYKADELVQYANKIKLPESYDPSKPVGEQRDALMKWIVDCTIKVYIMCDIRNDFVILHAVTSAWSLKNILSLVENSNDVIQSVRVFLCILLGTYAARECPDLKTEYLPQDGEKMPSWDELMADAVGRETDEHIYKLVQVCHDMAVDYPDDSQMAAVYKEAAKVALYFPLVIGRNTVALADWE